MVTMNGEESTAASMLPASAPNLDDHALDDDDDDAMSGKLVDYIFINIMTKETVQYINNSCTFRWIRRAVPGLQ